MSGPSGDPVCSISEYGGGTGMLCAVLVDDGDPEIDCATVLLMSLRRLWRLEEAAAPPLDVFRGGTPFPSSRGLLLSALLSMCLLAWLCEGTSSSICVSPVSLLPRLAPLAVLVGACTLLVGSLGVRVRSFACFRLRPWSRLMMMSRIRGKKLSRLCGEAGWLRVSSNIDLNKSGTGPRSEVSTPIELNALQARLNS